MLGRARKLRQLCRKVCATCGWNSATTPPPDTALVDFLKLRKGAGEETNWLVTKLIQGEKRVKVTARIQSANGRATVTLQRVEIGGLAVSGSYARLF